MLVQVSILAELVPGAGADEGWSAGATAPSGPILTDPKSGIGVGRPPVICNGIAAICG